MIHRGLLMKCTNVTPSIVHLGKNGKALSKEKLRDLHESTMRYDFRGLFLRHEYSRLSFYELIIVTD